MLKSKWSVASLFGAMGLCLLGACSQTQENTIVAKQGVYTIYDEKALELLDLSEPITTLGSGFKWAEGPLWIKESSYLLFSDIPNNRIVKYSPRDGLSDYLNPSGFSNGLVRDGDDLVLMQSRSRSVSRLTSAFSPQNVDSVANASAISPMVSKYQSKRLNSPNDVALHSNGTLFFTDPPYGLPKQMDDPSKELSFQGVYRLSKSGELTILDDEITFPNGIALSPKQDMLYVAVSDENAPIWYQYELDNQGNRVKKSVFFVPQKSINEHGVPDGLQVHSSGVVFATGPSGVWLIDEDKTLLAHIEMAGFTANLAFDDSEQNLYLTAADELRVLKLKQ